MCSPSIKQLPNFQLQIQYQFLISPMKIANQPRQKAKEGAQIKALFLKNGQLQAKQPCTNICQIITPVICLIFTYLIKELATQNLPPNSSFTDNPYPYIFDNYVMLDQYSRDFKNSSYPARKNTLEWYLVDCRGSCSPQILGDYDGSARNTGNNTILGLVPNLQNNSVNFKANYYTNPNVSSRKYLPFFYRTNDSNKDLFNRLNTIGQNSYEAIKDGKQGLDYLPDGAITFSQLSQKSLKAKLQINDVREIGMHRNNGVSALIQTRTLLAGGIAAIRDVISAYGSLTMQHIISASYIKYQTGKTLKGGYVLMRDTEGSKSFVDSIINTVSALIFPLSLSLLFPVMLYGLVLQKQQKLVQMMKMNGMRISNYWLVYFIFNFILCLVTNIVFFLLGAFALKTDFFKKTSPALLSIIAIGWSLAQIGLAAFCQTFLSKARSANIIGYIVAIWTMMIASTLNIGAYQVPTQFPGWLQALAPFAFNRLFYLMLINCSDADCYNSLQQISPEMKNCIVALYMGFIVFFLLGAYLMQVLPQQYGVRRHPLFPFIALKNFITGKNKTTYIHPEKDRELKRYMEENEEDPLSRAERERIAHITEVDPSTPLIINNLRKLYQKQGYKGPYPAVKSFNLRVEDKETFGLLGPNGAGKTTLISMLTGMVTPNYGNAWIGGFDIQTNVSKSQLEMGVCPQFDLLWPQLTVEEHLRFYARLKGIPSGELENRISQAIQQVHLTEFKHFVSSSLSGGMKRRLSIAISLVGDPKIVFLDEPSSGLDPQNRRQIWQVLAKCQQKRAVFLTTHMMQEADALCHRIGIITHGALRTVGNQLRLKKDYGEGYRLSLSLSSVEKHLISPEAINLSEQNPNLETEQQNQMNLRRSISEFVQKDHIGQKKRAQLGLRKISDYISSRFNGAVLSRVLGNSLIFKIPSTHKISEIFMIMKQAQRELDITNVAITDSSLEDVFISVVKKYDKILEDEETGELGLVTIPLEEEIEMDRQELQRDSFPSDQFSHPVLIPKVKSPEEQKFGSLLSKNRESVLSEEQMRKSKESDQ